MVATFEFTPTSRYANSYSSEARAALYFAERPNSGNWTGGTVTSDQKQQALMTATKAIDAYPGIIDNRFLNYNADQRLYFPSKKQALRTGVATAGGAATLTDTVNSDLQQEPDDFWNYGGLRITIGTGSDQVREVSDYVSSTGVLTVVSNWVTNPDTTSNYELIEKIPEDIFTACMEIAYGYMPNVDTGVVSDETRARLQSQKVKSFSVGNHSETFGDGPANGFKYPLTAVQLLDRFVVRCY